jgi:hypothetical protein
MLAIGGVPIDELWPAKLNIAAVTITSTNNAMAFVPTYLTIAPEREPEDDSHTGASKTPAMQGENICILRYGWMLTAYEFNFVALRYS